MDVRCHDEQLLSAIVAGDRDAFLAGVRANSDRSRVCGLAPVYMTLWAAEASDGMWMGYRQCPADDADTSFVSIAGALLY
jgi:predicted class III extradiol MEMO1 family dioxygenase